jgi:phosphatidylglycerol---prolipoprotein diacylglyceryl transferase
MSMLASIPFPNIDPVLFSIGPLAVRWYALAYIAGLLFASWYIKRLVTDPRLWNGSAASITPKQVDDLFIWALLGVVLGGRIGYVLFYEPMRFLASPLEIFNTMGGGMSFHGGFIGVILACYFFGRGVQTSMWSLLDLAATAVPVGLGLGRVANFINAELYGRASDAPWAVVFPGENFSRHPSQIYEAILEGLVLFVVIRFFSNSKLMLPRTGFISGVFALGYGLSRIVVEFFREPDTQIGYFAGFITMGMILSLPLVIVGLALLWWSRKSA